MHSYRDRMAGYARSRAIEVYYASVAVSTILGYVDKRARPMIEAAVHSASHHDSIHELAKLTAIVDGKRRIVDRPPVILHRDDVTKPARETACSPATAIRSKTTAWRCSTATRSSTTR